MEFYYLSPADNTDYPLDFYIELTLFIIFMIVMNMFLPNEVLNKLKKWCFVKKHHFFFVVWVKITIFVG